MSIGVSLRLFAVSRVTCSFDIDLAVSLTGWPPLFVFPNYYLFDIAGETASSKPPALEGNDQHVS